MSNELSRRAMLAGSVGFAGIAKLAAAPANPAARPKYFHMGQSPINYQAEFNSACRLDPATPGINWQIGAGAGHFLPMERPDLASAALTAAMEGGSLA